MAKTTANHPHTYGAGTRLSSAYTIGRDGKPCPRHCAEPTSGCYAAWKRGHEEFRTSGIRIDARPRIGKDGGL